MHNQIDRRHVSVKDAALELAITPAEVRRMLENEELAGCQRASGWEVELPALRAMVRLRARQEVSVGQIETESRSTPTPLKVLSFFSGAMGLDQGLESAGMTTLLACEFDRASRETIRLNKPGLPTIGNIWQYDAETVRALAGLSQGESPDVMAGGPPCQAFSTAGSRKGLDDVRGNVFMHFLQLITELKPRYAVIENVRGLLSMPLSLESVPIETLAQFGDPMEFSGKHGVIRIVARTLDRAGYSVSFNLYNAANFGSAQVRERVVILAALNSSKVPYLAPTHSSNPEFGLPGWRTLRDVVGDLPDSNEYVKFPEARLKYFRMLSEGQNWRSLPEELQPEAMGKSFHLGGGKTGFYRRLAWDKPSPTLVTHPAMPATDLCHPTLNRPLSVGEYRRLQDFPDTWHLAGSLTDQYRQLGNAVPVRLGEAIGKAIVNHDKGIVAEPPNGFPYSRYRGTSDLEVLTPEGVRTLF